MILLEQIAAAHSRVKSGADFPAFIQELKKIGVATYCTFVNDGHTDYYLENGLKASTDPKYKSLEIAKSSDRQAFQEKLQAHQQGRTDYPTFCDDAAINGVDYWVADLEQMTCTYIDISGAVMLQETISEVRS